MTDTRDKYMVIYTDGSALGNPGRAGFGYLIWDIYKDTITDGGGFQKVGTNNQMEMYALLQSLQKLHNIEDGYHVTIFLDSEYVRNGITSWVHNWKKNNWITANKKSVLNKEIWQELDVAFSHAQQKHTITLKRVPGHAGIAGNEHVDKIAKSMAENNTWNFFSGSAQEFEEKYGYNLDYAI